MSKNSAFLLLLCHFVLFLYFWLTIYLRFKRLKIIIFGTFFSSDSTVGFRVRQRIVAKRQHSLDSRSPIGAQRWSLMDSVCAKESVVAVAPAIVAESVRPFACSTPAALMAPEDSLAAGQYSFAMAAPGPIVVLAMASVAAVLYSMRVTIVSSTNRWATNWWRLSLMSGVCCWSSFGTAAHETWTLTNWCLGDTATCCWVQHFHWLNSIWNLKKWESDGWALCFERRGRNQYSRQSEEQRFGVRGIRCQIGGCSCSRRYRVWFSFEAEWIRYRWAGCLVCLLNRKRQVRGGGEG